VATLVTPTNLQKMEFNVTTAEGPSRVTIITGKIEMFMYIGSTGPAVSQNYSFKALVDPTLTPGQFRKATATASMSGVSSGITSGVGAPQTSWAIEDAQATFDDETGRVQLIVNTVVGAIGANAVLQANKLMFQVTTLAMA
jgi:hypothetical protein